MCCITDTFLPYKGGAGYLHCKMHPCIKLSPGVTLVHLGPNGLSEWKLRHQKKWENFVYFMKTWWYLRIKFYIIGKSMCLPFQQHLIHYNRLLLNEGMALWIWLGHKSNVPKFNNVSVDQSIRHLKSMEWRWSSHCNSILLMTEIAHSNFDFPTLMLLSVGLLTTIVTSKVMVKSNRVFDIQTNEKQFFNLLRNGIVSKGFKLFVRSLYTSQWCSRVLPVRVQVRVRVLAVRVQVRVWVLTIWVRVLESLW